MMYRYRGHPVLVLHQDPYDGLWWVHYIGDDPERQFKVSWAMLEKDDPPGHWKAELAFCFLVIVSIYVVLRVWA